MKAIAALLTLPLLVACSATPLDTAATQVRQIQPPNPGGPCKFLGVMAVEGGAQGYVRIAAELLQATFGEPGA